MENLQIKSCVASTPHLNDSGKVFSSNVVLSLHIKVTQLTGPHRVVLGIELIKALKGLSALQEHNLGSDDGVKFNVVNIPVSQVITKGDTFLLSQS